jgi:hypothetical protein
MAEPDAAPPRFRHDSENIVVPQQANGCAESVLRAYSAAIGRASNERSAYDAAVSTYLLYHPNMPEEAARAAVARIISSKE